MYVPLRADIPRHAEKVWDPVAGEFRRALGMSMSSTNLLLHSNDPTNVVWGKHVELPCTSRAGIFEQENGTLLNGFRVDNAGGVGWRSYRQIVGTLSANPEAFSVVVRNVDAIETSIAILDQTASNWVVFATWNWSTLTFTSVVGAVGTNQRAGADDLGNGFWRLWCVGTPINPGNVRIPWVYPTGTAINTDSVEVYHHQHELHPFASPPIVTGAASATREVERMHYVAPATEPMIVYASWIERGNIKKGDVRRYWQIGDGTAPAKPRAELMANVMDQYWLLFANTTGVTTSSFLPLVTPVGSFVETLSVLRSDWIGRLAARVNGGPVFLGDTDPSVAAPTTTWTQLDLNSTGEDRDGISDFLTVKIVKAAAPVGQATLNAALMDEMRDLAVAPDGSLIDPGV